ncbi:hypothetical protein VA7868_00516 [Vibrio aerogenes CECT 7868]|uniref:Bacterial extracellular solute-binding proteins, family 3 n=1 Tax=Vibrio aerogenes CECT 7868 TaxID=1216006 RepID=A0A1M5VUX7_9VIBR|nr:amino acid ABC transporter substrate-binding protein [Vibrio aerogenes]SHH79055.1 hypothetical protein VA7868_00516 [Vibrio aerogenes CECT 7868]
MRYMCAVYAHFLVLFLSFSPQASAKPAEFIYPVKKSEMDHRYNDVIELIDTALQKTLISDGPYILRPARIYMSWKRSLAEIKKGSELNIIWGEPTQENLQHLIPVRIPLRKGLSGYHLLFVRTAHQAQFAQVNSPGSFRKLRPGLWTKSNEVDIFRLNGFDYLVGNSYEGLFRMLMIGRFDYLPRSVNEIFKEAEQRTTEFPQMAIEETLALYYPLPLFLLVSKDHPELARRLEKGLNAMVNDGSFDQIFYKYHRHSIEKANLNHRKVMRMLNPLLSNEFIPFDRKKLWLNVADPEHNVTPDSQ